MEQRSRVAIVTGANRGIGYEICKELSKTGCSVVLTSRNEVDGKKAISSLNEYDNIVYHKLDVTDINDISDLRDWILKTYGRLDILINNAGIYLDEAVSVIEVDEKIIQETLAVNFYGAFRMCKAFVPVMKQNGYGRIVNISSGMGQ
jgi:NAD(P)-dependent dehydrogenase (short-subunit alcohol dehydrogenase family)